MNQSHRIQRVLHIEYRKPVIQDVKLTLFKDRLHSYHLKTATTKNEVLRSLDQGYPNLIICANKLNGFDSQFVIEETKRRLPNCPVILLSEEVIEEHSIPHLKKGIWDVVHIENQHLLPISIFKVLREAYFRENVPLKKEYKGMEIQPLPREIGRWILHR